MKRLRPALFAVTLIVSASAVKASEPPVQPDGLTQKALVMLFAPLVKALDGTGWIADKTYITSLFEGLGTVGFMKNCAIGNWLVAQKGMLGKAVVLAVVSGGAYYVWNKYNKSQEEEESFDLRAFFEEDFDEDTSPQDEDQDQEKQPEEITEEA